MLCLHAMDKENIPPSKKRKLSLSLNRNGFKDVDEEELATAQKGFVPNNTSRCNKWALNNFEAWRTSGSLDDTAHRYPKEILLTDDKKELCSCLCKYVMETRKENGEPYPPKTVFNLLSGLLRFTREKKANAFNFLSQSDADFAPLQKVMDSFFRQLHADGIGTRIHQSDVLSYEDEASLWDKSVLGVDNPQQLIHAVFFYCGLNFCLRGGDEHRGLKLSQLKRVVLPDPEDLAKSTVCYEYIEHGSKNNLGGLKQVRKRQPNKVVRHFANPAIGDKCLVRLLDLYFSKRPEFKDHNSDSDAFYLRPLEKYSNVSGKPWYYTRAIGHNTLKGMMKSMCKEAGIPAENKSNHSLRATAATRMLTCRCS